jgi:signal transduction histidine kinase
VTGVTSARVSTGLRRRTTLHALAGLPAGLAGGALLGGVALLWAAAVWSLVTDPTGDWLLTVLYALTAVTAPVLLPACVLALSALQRARFRVLLGIQIPAARRAWRQVGYHLLAAVLGTAGGLVVALCWSAIVPGLLWWPLFALAPFLLLAAPWVARGVAAADMAAARALLAPSRADRLALRVESLSRSRADIVAATDAERRRIERDLHDGAQQRLVSLAMNLGMARETLDLPADARQVIEQAHDEAIQALAELREFVRGLHPAVLDDRGLDAALSGIAARMPLPVRLHVEVSPRCSPSVEAIAYFVVSEALTNVTRHANAAHAEVVAVRVGDRLRIEVTDDGRGGAALSPGGSGLRGLAQRAAAVDGTLSVHSPAGGPTTITVELPCES